MNKKLNENVVFPIGLYKCKQTNSWHSAKLAEYSCTEPSKLMVLHAGIRVELKL